MDDIYRGLYLNIEEVDQQFIADVLGKPQFVSVYEGTDGNEPDSGQLARRVGSSSSEEKFAGKGYKKIAGQGESKFQDFEELVNRIDSNLKLAAGTGEPETLSEIFDIESFIKWMAVNQLIGGWDNYYFNAKNYFLVNSGTVAKPYFQWVAIDLDNSFGISFTRHDWSRSDILDWESVRGGTHSLPLVRLVLTRPEWKKKYLQTLEDLISLDASKTNVQLLLFKKISTIWNMIESSVKKESDSEGIDYSKPDPFKMAHTARQFTTSDIRAQVTADSIDAGDPYGWANMTTPHIRSFIKRKWKNVSEQLNRAR
jgi:spore coat protein CotH